MNRVSAKLSIWSDSLSAEAMSKFLQFAADSSSVKGNTRIPARPWPSANGWHLTCRENNKVMAGEVLDVLIERIKPITGKINQLKLEYPSIKINFFLHVAPKTTDISLYISSNSIAVIADLNGDFDVEFFDL